MSLKIIILTSSKFGTASAIIPKIYDLKNINIVGVVYNNGKKINKRIFYLKKIKKIFKIGFFGALNGIRMRKWYKTAVIKHSTYKNVENFSKEKSINFFEVESINSINTAKIFKSLKPDLGISLGNGYIGTKIFSIPKYGMINIHHEILPDLPGAQSVIWQLYHLKKQTGYTIHKVNKYIDRGEIMYQEKFKIVFKNNLASTVAFNYYKSIEKSSFGLKEVLLNFDKFFNNSKIQNNSKNYTTPTIYQFIKILKNFYILKNNSKFQKQ